MIGLTMTKDEIEMGGAFTKKNRIESSGSKTYQMMAIILYMMLINIHARFTTPIVKGE